MDVADFSIFADENADGGPAALAGFSRSVEPPGVERFPVLIDDDWELEAVEFGGVLDEFCLGFSRAFVVVDSDYLEAFVGVFFVPGVEGGGRGFAVGAGLFGEPAEEDYFSAKVFDGERLFSILPGGVVYLKCRGGLAYRNEDG